MVTPSGFALLSEDAQEKRVGAAAKPDPNPSECSGEVRHCRSRALRGPVDQPTPPSRPIQKADCELKLTVFPTKLTPLYMQGMALG